MKLYYNPQSRAVIAKWMLDECGAQYEIVAIDFAKREHKAPEFLKINPAGKLPALVDGVPWSTPWLMAANYAAMFFVYCWLAWRFRRTDS